MNMAHSLFAGSHEQTYPFSCRVASPQATAELDAWLAELAAASDATDAPRVVGLDCEWSPQWWRKPGVPERIETIQLYSPSCGALLFSARGGGPAVALPLSLVQLLGDECVVFVGVGVRGDGQRLARDFGVVVNSLHDLSGGGSLMTQANATLPTALHVEKPAKSSAAANVRLSNWGAWPLSAPQLRYAALDAVLSYWIFAYARGAQWTPRDGGSATDGLAPPLAKRLRRSPRRRAAPGSSPPPCSDTRSGSATGSRSLLRDVSTLDLHAALPRQDAGGPPGPPGTVTACGDPLVDGGVGRAAAASKHSDFYVMHRNRSIVPPRLHAKVHPRGPSDALVGVVAIISGVLDSMQRGEMRAYISAHGGRVVKSVSRKVTHLINDHGEVGRSKKSKCDALHIPVVSEDAIFALVRSAAQRRSAATARVAELKEDWS